MIHEAVKQGGAKWHRLRLGIPTSSHFDEILTPKTLTRSKSAPTYLRRLLAEWLTGIPHDAGSTGFMERGKDMEPRARKRYAFETGRDADLCGVVLRDDRMVAGSPDSFVGEDGLIEIKTPGAPGHVGNLLDGMAGYESQVQGCLWLTGRAWCDLVSYHPDLPLSITRYERNELHIEALDEAVSAFVDELVRARERLLKMGCVPAEKLNLPLSTIASEGDPF